MDQAIKNQPAAGGQKETSTEAAATEKRFSTFFLVPEVTQRLASIPGRDRRDSLYRGLVP